LSPLLVEHGSVASRRDLLELRVGDLEAAQGEPSKAAVRANPLRLRDSGPQLRDMAAPEPPPAHGPGHPRQAL